MSSKKSSAKEVWNPKLRGEWAELQFMARCAGQGFRIAKPYGDSSRYDVIVEHDLGFHRVQVKSTSRRQGHGYICGYHSAVGHWYTVEEVDFFAVYVVPKDTWYIIPSAAITTKHVYLDARPGQEAAKYEPYREAWHLLREPGRFDIKACADVNWIEPPSAECHPEGFEP